MDAAGARQYRDLVADIHLDAYAEEVAAGGEFSSTEAFLRRFDAYTSRDGFDLVFAHVDGVAVGQAWGWALTPGSAWWNGLETEPKPGFADEDGTRTFALSEIMVRHSWTGQGIARALHDTLLAARTEQRATLLVRPDNTTAYGAYTRWAGAKSHSSAPAGPTPRSWTCSSFLSHPAALTNGHLMTAENTTATLEALRQSIRLALETDGPAGGPLVRENLETAIGYYDISFSAFPPALLAVEVHRTRALVGTMLRQPQSDAVCTDLRRLAGWLSALVGNLAFSLGDYTGARVHLGTATRLGSTVGDAHLTCWSLGLEAMTANAQRRFSEALDLSRQALEHADTPLRRAQILAWGQLRSLANLGTHHRSDATRVMAAAQEEMAADPHSERPGRFGFDNAELRLHLAEASLQFGDHTQGRTHAEVSRTRKTAGSPGWAAATLVLARVEAAHGNLSDAVGLATEVLDIVPADAIRETSRIRLHALEWDLFQHADPGRESHDLHERLRVLPTLVTVERISEEPNGL